jgi:NAD(P)H dehydrogenase (quinone)
MNKLAVVYHSGYGHTQKVAQSVSKGAEIDGIEVSLLNIDTIEDVNILKDFDAIIWGAPTYMGSVSGQFKVFMDKTSSLWFTQELKDKITAGFTCSGSLSGDKSNTLFTLATFAAQHGMVWLGQSEANASGAEDKTAGDVNCVNRAGFYLGLGVQADNVPAEESPVSGDLQTAELFGKRIASATLRWNK